MRLQVRCKRMGDVAVEMPRYARDGDAGMDLRAAVREEDNPAGCCWIIRHSVRYLLVDDGARALVPVGWAFEIPPGYEGQVRPRSSMTKAGIYCAFGTIDSGYRGEVKVHIENRSGDDFLIRTGDRIAQIVFAPVASVLLQEADELEASERGDGGFGSTGIREHV